VLCAPHKQVRRSGAAEKLYLPLSRINFDSASAGFGLALHMHQPTIPAGGDDIQKAPLISNLQYMMEHQGIGDNHNAPVFRRCYERMSDFIRELAAQGKHPRIMLDYSGNLLWGLQQQYPEVIDKLKLITEDSAYYAYVEWLGTMWSHAVVSSTPVPDIGLHISAWRQHFSSLFGEAALERVKGFSAPEMHLPVHPDVCFEYIKALRNCGYEWLMVQEHTIENLDGSAIRRPHLPHRLVAKNSYGQVQEITVLIKTQGSDTKLVAQMQPYYEACGLGPERYADKEVIPYVLQISDGENGGVMMNEFPPKYKEVFFQLSTEGTVALNGSEYLEYVQARGISPKDFMAVQPVGQYRIWQNIRHYGKEAADKAIEKIREKDQNFNLERASWTNDRDWVKGYESVLGPISTLSAAFHERFDRFKEPCTHPVYNEALLYLLLSQTSCFRYWGQGIWTDYAKEICRRGFAVLSNLQP